MLPVSGQELSLIPIYKQLDAIDLWHLKIRILIKKVSNIQGLEHQVANISGL